MDLAGDDVGHLLLGVGGAEPVDGLEPACIITPVVGIALVAHHSRWRVLLEEVGAGAEEGVLGRAALVMLTM